MCEKELYFRYGEIKGRLDTIVTYCEEASYVDKDILKKMLMIPDDPVFEEPPQLEIQSNEPWF